MAEHGGAMSETLALPNEERVTSALKHRFFLRLHMTFILGVTFAAGLVTTRLLLAIHLDNLGARYAIAVCAAFAVFLGFVRLWLAYVGFLTLRHSVDINGDGVNVSFSGGGSGGGGDVPRFSGGGGSGGGGGATESWGTPVRSSGGGGGGGSKFDLDFGDDWGLILLIIVLVLAIAVAVIYVIYAAPVILSEAAFNAALTGALARRTKHATSGSWEGSVIKSTALP